MKKTTMDDLKLFTRCLLACCFYGFSPKTLLDDKVGFPYFYQAIQNLGGKKKIVHILSCLKSNKINGINTWYNYFDESPHIRELEL